MKTFFEVKSQLRANMLMEHFAKIKITTVELVPGNIYQFLSEEKKVILALEPEEIPYLIDERAFFCLEYYDHYYWKYAAKNTNPIIISTRKIDGHLHRTCDNVYIKPSMMLIDSDQVKYIVLKDINDEYVYYNLSTREYQYTFDKDIIAIYDAHDPEINARRLIWGEKEKKVSIEELVECYGKIHNIDPKNIIVI